MANYATLKAAIAAAIKQNGNNEITGNLLQQQLLAMVNSLGVGYQYAGIATAATDPGTPDQNVFYLASTAGTYTNFNGLVLIDGEIAILRYNGVWSKDSTGAASLEMVYRLGQNKSAGTVTTAYNLINTNIKSGEKVIYKIDIPSGTSRVFLFYNGNGSNRIADTAGMPAYVSGQEVEWIAVADISSFGLFVSDAPSDVTLTIKYGLFLPVTNIADNAVSTSKIQNDSITGEKLANGSVGSSKISEGGVHRSNILNYAVDNSKLATNSILPSKLRNFTNIAKNVLPIQSDGLGIFEPKNKNLVSRVYPGCFFNDSSFDLQSNSSYDVLFCPVKESRQYVCNTNIRFISFLNENGEIQTASQTNNQFSTISGTAFAIISVYATTEKQYQVEEGTTPTGYVAYAPVIKNVLLPQIDSNKIFISKTDTQFEIFDKMLSAFTLGNCDVIFEKGTYTFDDVFVYMRYSLGWNWTMELPIGKGCRYFFNGSTLIANYPTDTYRQEHYPWANPYDQPVNILGVKAGGMGNTDFEIHDVTLINNGGTYCVHDECVNETTGYNHVYENCIIQYVQGGHTEALSKCIGGGAGRNGFIVIKNCVFVNGNSNASTEDVSWHGLEHPESAADVSKLTFMINGCYFSRKFRVGGSFKTGDENILKYSNNSHDIAPSVENLVASYIFNNELR